MLLDWPNLVAGGALGFLFTHIPRVLQISLKRLTGVKPTYRIDGIWYSAEYDLKSADPDRKNTILEVILKKTFLGTITVRPTKTILLANEKRPTSWIVRGEMHGTILEGKWRSTVEHCSRFGTVLLAFYDGGRGIGYYLGFSDTPTYGYWLLCRDEAGLRELSSRVNKKFRWNDLKTLVDSSDPRSNKKVDNIPIGPSS